MGVEIRGWEMGNGRLVWLRAVQIGSDIWIAGIGVAEGSTDW
jgi:hypothetical protein